jgi:hypothetical protein
MNLEVRRLVTMWLEVCDDCQRGVDLSIYTIGHRRCIVNPARRRFAQSQCLRIVPPGVHLTLLNLLENGSPAKLAGLRVYPGKFWY